ncbi:Bacterial mobilisation protein (MobC) (plasmid) [Sodalis glossinidius str. 'morsitans']|uniref:Bacterial mobilisation protein (MobC) n=2 Tax=Sodalis glossinidius TaxID=63612 RepID=A0A193QNZ8_SODGM|nr:plasmid mobilization relaxosome protein MobC [Sodalis glossinidius]CAI59375.2 MobC protein [Sodalis glossinidius]CAI59589.2 MobC protein [Sodalis glossinidius]CRL46891.1 Bacterial mobilisation protein (MobC) [Sodalis glossinidius str. 'morsitans']CRL46905.1 Bacterial mobilisation protein (MobC) [Sodalis glossinidius str. 'morsitans']
MAEKKNKDRVVTFRLSQSDFAQFEEKLASSNMKKSAFFREVFLNANVSLTVKAKPSKDLESLTFLFNKYSNNLNQIAHQVNSAYVSGKVSSSLYTSVNNTLVDIRQLLLSGIQAVFNVRL